MMTNVAVLWAGFGMLESGCVSRGEHHGEERGCGGQGSGWWRACA